MQKKYKNKGVILLAISYEGENKVQEYIKKERIKYIVGADGEGVKKAYDVNAFPTAFLIDPDGKIAWKGHPGGVDTPLKDLLKEKPPKQKGFLALKSAKSAYKAADKLYKKKQYEEALDAYKDVARSYVGTKESKKAKAKINEMRGNSRIMEKIRLAKAERQAERWLLVARTLAENGDAKDAAKYYKRIIKECPNTESARYANAEVRDIDKGDGDEDEKEEAKDKDDDEKGAEKDKAGKDKDDGDEDDEDDDEDDEDDDEDDDDKDEDDDDKDEDD